MRFSKGITKKMRAFSCFFLLSVDPHGITRLPIENLREIITGSYRPY
jgi:hypothetical protein